MEETPKGLDPLALLTPVADILRSATASEESSSYQGSVDVSYDEQALDQLMGRYEHLAARMAALSEGGAPVPAPEPHIRDEDGFPEPEPRKKKQRRRKRAKETAGFEGQVGPV
mmetsp:Transcript_24295/g.72904  ORF Transcript_24295/g.72904 Transcript_24295/m.72904 type:complete len:113 (-) Transcript_24295:27-365(-)